jgi:hypothetical protein
MSAWTRLHQDTALEQGWGLFTTTTRNPLELQRVDVHDPEHGFHQRFQTDEEAWLYVWDRAELGDSLAIGAIEVLRRESPSEFAAFAKFIGLKRQIAA